MNQRDNINDLIKAAIKKAGYSQAKAADKLGISRQALTVKLGAANISDEFIDELKEKLNIDFTHDKTKYITAKGLYTSKEAEIKELEANLIYKLIGDVANLKERVKNIEDRLG